MFDEGRVNILLAVFFVTLAPVFLVLPAPIRSGGPWGHAFGIAGFVLMAFALQYSFRKRLLGRKGKRNPLATHIHLGLLGPTLIILHAGQGVAGRIGTLLFLTMILVVLSGITGRYLFGKVNRALREGKRDLADLTCLFNQRKAEIRPDACRIVLGMEPAKDAAEASDESDVEAEAAIAQESRCLELVAIAQSIAETEHAAQMVSATKALFSRWIRVHIILVVFLFSLALVHLYTSLYYGLRWLR